MRWQFLSHRIALSKVLTNTFSGEPPSKRFVLVLRALLDHPLGTSFGALTHYGKPGNSKSVPGRCATHLMFLPRRSVKPRQVCCVSYEQKWGRKNGPTRSGTIRQTNAKAYAATK